MYFMKMTDRINSSNYDHLVHKSANYSVSTRRITQRSAVLSMRQTLVSQPCCWCALRSPWGLRFTFIPGSAEVLQELTGIPAARSPVFLSPPWGGSRSGTRLNGWQGHGACVGPV